MGFQNRTKHKILNIILTLIDPDQLGSVHEIINAVIFCLMHFMNILESVWRYIITCTNLDIFYRISILLMMIRKLERGEADVKEIRVKRGCEGNKGVQQWVSVRVRGVRECVQRQISRWCHFCHQETSSWFLPNRRGIPKW